MRKLNVPRYRKKRRVRRAKVVERRILDALRSGEILSVAALARVVYEDHPDGGPEWALSCVMACICLLRRRGCPIETVRGYQLKSTWENDSGND
jgi:hypothetical protein